MKATTRWIAWAGVAALFALCILGFLVAPASAAVRVGVNVSVGDAPPCGIVFDREPGLVVVPGEDYRYVGDFEDADVYFAGSFWYAWRDGYWYRSHGWRGPWVCVELGRVPRRLVSVGSGYRHYRHVTPGEWRREHGQPGRERVREIREERREDRRENRREERRENRRENRHERQGRGDHGRR
jgi:hypothetical protein